MLLQRQIKLRQMPDRFYGAVLFFRVGYETIDGIHLQAGSVAGFK
jgi:hypothetical protein